jgi:hypothetical protein
MSFIQICTSIHFFAIILKRRYYYYYYYYYLHPHDMCEHLQTPIILNLDTRSKRIVNVMFQRHYPWEKSPVSIWQEAGWTESKSGYRCGKEKRANS